MLIDAGEQNEGQSVSAYLYEHDISSISYVVATHPHSDHIGGMDQILNNFKVEHFVDSGFPHTSKTYENMLTTIDKKNIPFEVAKKEEEIEFDPAVGIEVLNPGTEYSDELNENSVVLKVSYGEVSFLLMGDAGLETEEALMNEGYDLDFDILKVGHHASQSGSGEEFISLVSPEISIIEVGAGNDYGHPHTEVLERLQQTSRVYRTDLDGTITVLTDGSTYTVSTEKTGSGDKTKTISRGAYSSTTSGITEESEPEESTMSTMSTIDSAGSPVYISDLNLQDGWVKITNKESSPVPLKGWKIEDEGSKHTFTFPTCTLDSRATVILHTGTGTDTDTEIYWRAGSPIWNNDGDAAYLYDDKGKLVSLLER
jgi:beta-lactamase superfamily II metal-dependent hydrolase